LGEGHAEKLIPAGKATDFVVSVKSLDQAVEMVMWHPLHELRENEFFVGHDPSWHISCWGKTVNFGLYREQVEIAIIINNDRHFEHFAYSMTGQ